MLVPMFRPTSVLAVLALAHVVACTKSSSTSGELEGAASPPVEAEPVGAQADLDHTLWDCEWNLAVFWGEHWHRAHRDVARLTMGGSGLFSREDFELSYGPEGNFTAAIRHRDYPTGERTPEELEGPAQAYTYTLAGDRLKIEASHWDEPLECSRQCYGDDFVQFMDARYETSTPDALVQSQLCGR